MGILAAIFPWQAAERVDLVFRWENGDAHEVEINDYHD
jgi:plasmid maintenance system killer protein